MSFLCCQLFNIFETSIIFFENSYKASGLKINTSKTRVVWVGNKRYSNQIICPDFKLDWSVSNFKLLGIDFSFKISYECISFDFFWFPIPYKIKK
jgi:hypothetical protein